MLPPLPSPPTHAMLAESLSISQVPKVSLSHTGDGTRHGLYGRAGGMLLWVGVLSNLKNIHAQIIINYSRLPSKPILLVRQRCGCDDH